MIVEDNYRRSEVMIMRRNWFFTAIVFTVLAISAGPAAAQGYGANQIEKLRQYLDQNDEILRNARDAVRTANNPLAEQTLVQAGKHQEEARGQFRNGQFHISFNLAQRARELAKSALSTARQSMQAEGVVLRRLERAREMLERLRENAPADTPEMYRAIYAGAQERLDRAWEFYHNGEYRPAIMLADQAEKAAHRLVNMARVDQRDDAQFERRREQVEALIEQARLAAADCGSEQGRQHLEQARQALGRSSQLEQEKATQAALQSLKRARELAMRAYRECQGGDQVRLRYERLVHQAEQLRQRAEQASGETRRAVKELLDDAGSQLDRAKDQFGNDQLEPALMSLQAAQLLLRKARSLLEGTL